MSHTDASIAIASIIAIIIAIVFIAVDVTIAVGVNRVGGVGASFRRVGDPDASPES